MKTQFKSTFVVAALLAVISLASCSKEIPVPSLVGDPHNPNYGIIDGTYYEPGNGPIQPQRQGLFSEPQKLNGYHATHAVPLNPNAEMKAE